jgi:acyl carrier protein
MTSREALEGRVIAIVADALMRSPSDVRLESSLIDDLGAESIDFLDLLFRFESAFHIKIADQDLWRGSLGSASDEELGPKLDALRTRMPGFRWDRFSGGVDRKDLPRLITVRTIVDYLESHGAKGGEETP